MAEEHKIGDTVWAKDPVKRYLTHAGKIVKIAPGFISIKKLSGSVTTHAASDVSKDFSKLNPNPYKDKKGMDESFVLKSSSGKVISTHFSEGEALKKKEELDKKTGETHQVSYGRTASPEEKNESSLDEGKKENSTNKSILEDILNEKTIANFKPPFHVRGNWVEDSRGNGICEMGTSRSALKDIAAALNAYTSEKNESEINEISQSTVDSYKSKAGEELKQAKKYSKSEYGDIAKRVMQRRKKGLKMADTRTESVEENDSVSHLTQNLPGKATHITKKDIRHSDGGIVSGSTTLRNVEGDKYEIRSGRYKGKIATFHPDNLQKLDESNKEIKVGSIVKPKIGPHAGQEHEVIHIHDDGTFNIRPHRMMAKQIRYRLGAVRCSKDQLQESYEKLEESSMEDLATGKGDGKELKSSPDYKRERRRLQQLMAMRRERDARVKRGYKEDDKDLDEGSIEEVSSTLLKSYAAKAREDADRLGKQGDRAKTNTTKLTKYVKATKRLLNAHKAEGKAAGKEFYGE